MKGVSKPEVLDALELDTLPPEVREALLIRQEGGKTSTSKLKPMIDAQSADNRLRGMLQYHGAGTGRWAARRVQLHNLVRPKLKFKAILDVIAAFVKKDAADYIRVFYGSVLTVVSECLRSFLCAAVGHDLLAADFKNIEGRGLAWLAGEDWKLQAFRDYDRGEGPDLYLVSAARIYDTDASDYNEDSIERQHGKVAELACGFGGGVGAFQTMAKTYFVKVSDALAEIIKTKWRQAHPAIVRYWYALEEAAMSAVLNPGQKYSAGPKGRQVSYKMSGSFLWCQLPSKRVLCYPYPRIMPVMAPWGDFKDSLTYMTVMDEAARKKGKAIPDPNSKGDWQRVSTYGGKLAENVTQALCRDLLVAAIRNAEAGGYPVVLHVHDEVVSEVPKNYGSLEEFESLCSQMPPWANGLPVVAKGWRGERYRK